jgi:hypothetical protein
VSVKASARDVTPRARTWLTAGVWVAAAIAAVAFGVQRFTAAAGDQQPDLGGFFLPAAQAILSGESPYSVSGYFYSPLVALLLAPFASTDAAIPAWTAMRIVAGIAACVIGAFACAPRGDLLRAGAVGLLAMVTLLWSVPTSLDLWAGQVELLVLLTLVTAALAETRGWRFTSGLMLGLGAVIKTWPVLIAAWLLRSGWASRARQWMGVAVAALIAVALALLTGGPGAVVDMIRAPFAGAEQPLLAANSVWGLPRMLFSDTPMAEPLTESSALRIATTVILVAWVAALGVIALVRPGPPVISLFNVTFLVILLLPVSHYFYVILALPALWWWTAHVSERPRSAIAWIAVSVLALWWIVVFRIAPAGDGFVTTTWPSLLRIFAASLVAATVSVVCAAILHRGERMPPA